MLRALATLPPCAPAGVAAEELARDPELDRRVRAAAAGRLPLGRDLVELATRCALERELHGRSRRNEGFVLAELLRELGRRARVRLELSAGELPCLGLALALGETAEEDGRGRGARAAHVARAFGLSGAAIEALADLDVRGARSPGPVTFAGAASPRNRLAELVGLAEDLARAISARSLARPASAFEHPLAVGLGLRPADLLQAFETGLRERAVRAA